MPYLKLTDQSTHRAVDTREPLVRLGRDPSCTMVFTGDAAKVVSARHAEIRHLDGEWRLSDLGSRNGTYINGRRVAGATTLHPGDVVRLGESGPTLQVTAIGDPLDPTLVEHPALSAEPPARHPPETRSYAVTLVAAATGRRFEALGTRIRLGRGTECEVQPVETSHAVVSRVHAELTVGPTGGLVVRDAGSRNGTFLNGDRIARPMPIRLGDRIMLGPGGPVLIVEGLGTAPHRAVPRPGPGARGAGAGAMGPRTVMGLITKALADATAARKRGRRASTAFLEAVRGKIRGLTTAVVALMVLLGGGVYGVYWLLSDEVRQTERALRTAEDALASQLATGEARRLEAQRDLERLRDQLAAAERRAPSQALIDSLRRAVSAAEGQTASLDAKLRAIRGVDFAGIAHQNQTAVGLITAVLADSYYDGTGFAISPDGYMLTNWHVVADSAHPRADTIWVTMADQTVARQAEVIGASRERDLALLKIRDYQGPYLAALDWGGTKARQGEPAALIGFPAGSGFARDRSAAVRTSMTAGILSRVTADLIQFDGMTTGGSSGSPVFNANGEVVSVHRAGLRQGPGFALSVPVRYAIPLLPQDLRARLGIQ